MPTAEDRVGQVFERLTITGVERGTYKEALLLYTCVCGKTGKAPVSRVVRGGIRSCGCLKSEMTAARNRKHGLAGLQEYKIWTGMLTRCCNPKSKSYPRYGGSGVTVSDDWRSFESFYRDMGPRPSPDHSIERLNLHLGYEKGNCVWATRTQQARNKKTSIMVEVGGKQINLAEACESVGLDYHCAYYRYTHGWSIEKILSTPSRKRKRGEEQQ